MREYKMKYLTFKINLFLLTVALIVVACGSGSTSGIGGSGISAGSVTGFGSVFVNGVEFETGTATFEVEDSASTESGLKLGMRVRVNGAVNADGVTGTATSIKYEDQLEGPISSVITPDADDETRSFSVLGTTVIIDDADTFFEGTTYSTLATGDNIEISGFFDNSNVLHATRIELKTAFVANSTIVEMKGVVSGLSGSTFTLGTGLGTMTINAASADLSGMPNSLLANGQFVEVKGTLASAAATSLSATLVEVEDNDLGAEGNKSSIEGIVTRFVSITDFDIDGFAVNASIATLSPTNLVLAAGMHVEAEGTVSGGILQATSLELRGGDFKIHALASNVNSTAGTFDLKPIAGLSAIKVTVTTATRMEDKVSATSPFTVANIADGDFIEARGFVDATGTGIIATRVRRESPDDIILEGVVTAGTATSTSVTVLGVAVPVDANTEFKNTANTAVTQSAFFGLTALNTSLIKIKDRADSANNVLGIADEVELQTP